MNIPLYYMMQQCDKVIVESTTMPYMKSLYSCLNRITGNGYTDNFHLTVKGLESKNTSRVYHPKEVKIVEFFRFEKHNSPADNEMLYMIETTDGVKGTLQYSSGTFHERLFGNFFTLESGIV